MIAWSDKVYSFSKEEFARCKRHTKHTYCEKPSNIQNLVDNCIFGLINTLNWFKLAKLCPVKLVKDPSEFVHFTDQHMIFFIREPGLASVFCPDFSKIFPINSSGSVLIPTGCKISFRDHESHTMGHISKKLDIRLNLNEHSWRTDLSQII